MPRQAESSTLDTFHKSIKRGITFPQTRYALLTDYLAERLKDEGVEDGGQHCKLPKLPNCYLGLCLVMRDDD